MARDDDFRLDDLTAEQDEDGAEPVRRRGWFGRHKVLTALIALVGVLVAGTAGFALYLNSKLSDVDTYVSKVDQAQRVPKVDAGTGQPAVNILLLGADKTSGKSIAELLMDQSVIAGIGNIYRCEVLFRHRVDPFRPAKEIRPATFRAIWDDLVELLAIGVAFGQIITMDDQLQEARTILAEQGEEASTAYREGRLTLVQWRGADEAEVGQRRPAYEQMCPFPREFYVYQRDGQGCYTCGSRIRTKVVAGRNLFWCGRCQRRR